jgi:hypothetical protein
VDADRLRRLAEALKTLAIEIGPRRETLGVAPDDREPTSPKVSTPSSNACAMFNGVT